MACPRSRRARARRSGGFALTFLELRADPVLLELGQVIDEDLALQMVHLVLDARGRHAGGIQREPRAVAIERGDGDALRALDIVVDARNRQASLLVHRDALESPDLRVR